MKPAHASHSTMKSTHSAMKAARHSVKPARHSMNAAHSVNAARADGRSVEEVRGAAYSVENAPMGKARGSVEGASVSEAGCAVKDPSVAEPAGSMESSRRMRKAGVAGKGPSSVAEPAGKSLGVSGGAKIGAVERGRRDRSAGYVMDSGAEEVLRMDGGLGREAPVGESGTGMTPVSLGE